MDRERDELYSRIIELDANSNLQKRIEDALSNWTVEDIEQLIREIELQLSN